MHIITLPSHLTNEPDLSSVNQRLLTGEAALDWSHVKQASPESLRVLLANLDLVEHNDILGIDSVPEDLAELVLQVMAPEALQTEYEVEQDDATENVQYHSRDEGGEEWKGGNVGASLAAYTGRFLRKEREG